MNCAWTLNDYPMLTHLSELSPTFSLQLHSLCKSIDTLKASLTTYQLSFLIKHLVACLAALLVDQYLIK